MSVVGNGYIWITVSAVCAFTGTEMVSYEMRVDSSSVLEGARYGGVLQEPIFDG
jgi:hypothetical protein